ncbi:MAG: Ig-like domain-containing protein, partial [Aureliella sp.]
MSFKRKHKSRLRRLQIEGLEPRLALYGDPGFYLEPPPESYLSSNVDLYVARLAWEFDMWSQSPIIHGDFVQSQDQRAVIRDGKVLLDLVGSAESGDTLRSELSALHADTVAGSAGESYYYASAWVPLASLKSLHSESSVLYASFPGSYVLNTDAAGGAASNAKLGVTQVSVDARTPRIELPQPNRQNPPVSVSPVENEAVSAKGLRWSKLGGPLIDVADAWQNGGGVDFQSSGLDDNVYQVQGDRMLVTVVSKDTKGTELKKLLQTWQAEVVTTSEYGVDAWVDVQQLTRLQSLEAVTYVKPTIQPLTAAGLATTQGDASQKSDLVRSRMGYTGQGVTVGVISDSFNRLGGAATDVANGELPADVGVLLEAPAELPRPTDEGRAMLQIVHDVAPGANLRFASSTQTQAGFRDSVLALANNGAKVIVDDVLFPDEPMYMDGIVAQAVNTVAAQGVTYVSSAGNYGSNAYENIGFRASTASVSSARGVFPLFDFDPSSAVDSPLQSITLPANKPLVVALQWDDPFISAAPNSGGSTHDLDLYVLDENNSIVAASSSISIGRDAMEYINLGPFSTQRTLSIAIAGVATQGIGRFKYVLLRGGTITNYRTDSPTSYGHANAANTIAVGASNVLSGTMPPTLETYSSKGGTPILLSSSGVRLSTPQIRQTPDIIGPDNVNTSFFGVDSTSDADSFPNFTGTSASAPHIAGLAALLLQANPAQTSTSIYSALTTTSTDMQTTGFDYQTGYGYVNGLSATYKVLIPTPPDLIASSDSGRLNNDNITNITTPTFSGIAPAGSYVRLFIDGVFRSAVTLATNQTVYSLVSTALSDGTHSAYVTFAESATSVVQSSASAAISFTIRTVAPTFSGSIDLASSRDSGVSNSDNVTNLAPILAISGANPFLQLLLNGSVIASYLPNSSASYATPPQGLNTYTLRAIDDAGNVS